MLPFDEYTNGWIIYGLSVIGLLFVFWLMVRNIPWRYIRQPLFLAGVVFLATPTIGNENYWAPAWIIGSLELLFSGLEAATPIFTFLLIVCAVVWILYIVFDICRYYYQQKKPAKPKKTSARVAKPVAH